MARVTVKLGDILERKRELIKIDPLEEYKLITIKLHHKGVILREKKKGKDIKSLMSRVRAGDFVLSGIDARNGAFGIIPPELDNAIVTNDFWCLVPNERVIKKEYLLFITSTDYFDYICNQSSDGTTQRIRLQKEPFFNHKITIPELKEQEEILKDLTYYKSITSLLYYEYTNQFDLLKKLRQQILQDAVQGRLLKSSPPFEGEYSRDSVREGVISEQTSPASGHPSLKEATSPASGHPSFQGGEQLLYKSISNLPELKSFRRELRKRLTPAEATLWTLLSNRKLEGRKFRRQHSIGRYILDFFCPEERLAVELDGEVHMNITARERDRERDLFLLYTGVKVLRFENRMVFDMPESLLKEIRNSFGWWRDVVEDGGREESTTVAKAPSLKEWTSPASGHPSFQGGEQYEDARVLLEKIKAEKEKLIREDKIKREKTLLPVKPEEIPFEIPENWVWCRLRNIGIITGGGTPSMANPTYWNGDIPWISPKDMDCEFVTNTLMRITRKGIDNSSAKLIPKGSIIIVGRSGILKRKLPVAINEVDSTVNQDMKVIVPYLTSMNRYIQVMLFGMEQIVLKQYVKFGMTVHSLRYEEFADMPIPLPPIHEQQRIVTKVEQLMTLCDELEQTIRMNQKYTQDLLQVALKEALEPE